MKPTAATGLTAGAVTRRTFQLDLMQSLRYSVTMPAGRKETRAYTLYNLVTTAIQEAAVAAAAFLLLPRFGITIPLWLLVAIMVAWAVYSYFSFMWGKEAIGRAPAVGPETLVGLKCRTMETLSPYGYVRVGPELWRARSIAGNIDPGTEVVIVDVKGLTLVVKPLTFHT